MTILIRAEFKRSAWHITRVAHALPDRYDEALTRRASEVGRAWLKAEFARSIQEADPWRLEYFKSCIGDGETAIGLGELQAQACVARRDAVHEVCALPHEASVRALVAALQSRGEQVAVNSSGRSLDRLITTVAAVVAAITAAGTLIRTIHESSTIPRDAGVILAVHGEWSNRTRHVLPMLQPSGKPVPVIALGRPRRSLASLRRIFDEALDAAPLSLTRPYSLRTALRSAGKAARLVARAVRHLSIVRYVPPLRVQAAMLYRLILGAASAHWWRGQGVRGSTVIYGHTGLADTTLLELAQHATGCSTVHVVHGLGSGPNFAGFSSHAVMRCSYDAEYYRELGGYGACHAPEHPTPACRHGALGWLLLTNLAHPMNRGYQRAGIRDELRLLGEVGRAADESRAQKKVLAWKPHPVFFSLPADQRGALLEAAHSYGFTIFGQDWTLERAREFEVVLCTASTIAVDMLRLGVLPIIFDVQPIATDSAIARLPLRAEQSAVLGQLIDELARDQSAYERYFSLAWKSIGPARAYDMRLILELAGEPKP